MAEVATSTVAADTRTVTAMATPMDTPMVTPMVKATAIQMDTQMVEGLRAEEDELLKDAQSILEDSHIKLRSHIYKTSALMLDWITQM